MLKNSSAYFVLWTLFQFLVEINCQMAPPRRDSHTATLVDNKLYILGGTGGVIDESLYIIGNDFFYLDVSVPFNTKRLLWKDISSVNTVPDHYDATSVKGGPNNNTFFLYRGTKPKDNVMMPLVYTFDPQSNSWTIPKITGDNTIRKDSLMGIIDNNGKMYLWGGGMGTDDTLVNDMLILDTINLSWGKGSSVGAPTPRINYGAILLPNRKIIYIGGRTGYYLFSNNTLAINEVYLYDTDEDSWSTQSTSGDVPSNRHSFSSVLGLDGQRVILFGGFNANITIAPKDSLYVLDTSTFEWYVPKVSGTLLSNRYYHKANVIGKYMVISFGTYYDPSEESHILLLDISNNDEYKWVNDFEPPPPSPSPSSKIPTSSSQTSTPLSLPVSSSTKATIIGTAIGSSVCGALLAVICFLLYRWNKNKQKRENAIPTPGNEEGNKYNHENLIIPKRNIYNQGNQEQEKITGDNHGSEIIPVVGTSTLQNIDNSDSALQQLKNEILQTLRQEFMQNSGQQNNGK
ncbi:unnamed protein product [Rhizophagus irregularis]|uniref:Galactose oxidase n=1 Tax=Rhizophagus irregularis TaxID=588596 RepID=A0A2I1HET8_9GLOM|nr:galactose oxidase [Rhizophagus irregularis]CAB4433430.1 unnamed protein product [Rhizophagus irregularis]